MNQVTNRAGYFVRSPLDAAVADCVAWAFTVGWIDAPQIGYGVTDRALMRRFEGCIDIVTLPVLGDATIVRTAAQIAASHPRIVSEYWRYNVPVDIALQWIQEGAVDDRGLQRWASARR